ncbi:hypothetical protein [Methanoregula sp.]|uniref:hypothetical protein n=1 Tax=Methanoregula sp. TaxID=2052170 RepID=UPI003562898C
MRLTMRPVTLSRVVETLYFAEMTRAFSKQELTTFLKSSEERGKDVADEIVNIGLLEKDGTQYYETKKGSEFLDDIRTNNWISIHNLMMDYSFYQTFFTQLQSIEPSTPEEILTCLQSSPVHFNQASCDVLCDWGERIGSIQRNIFTNQYFTITELSSSIIPAFLDSYQSLNIKTGLSLRQRYVEIPKIREYICQNMRISRDSFDSRFIQLCMKNIGKIELAGAPVTTHAKRSANKVKNVHFLELPDKITMKLSSNQYLNGLNVGPKSYYYVAYHGGELID